MNNKKTADDILNMIRDRAESNEAYEELKAASAKALKQGDYDLVAEIHEELVKFPQHSTDLKAGKRNIGIFVLCMAVMIGFFMYESPEDKARDQAKQYAKAEDKRKGFHCLSGWDGSLIHDRPIKNMLRDPDSYQHIETRITPNNNGYHNAYVSYRAKNGFGGYVNESIGVKVSNSSCKIVGAI